MSKLSIRLGVDTVRTLGFAAIGASYAMIGTAFTHPIRMLFIQNLTDATQWFSLDGVNNHFPLLSQGFLLLDVTSNKDDAPGLYIPVGDAIYVKDLDVATAGNVYVTAFYGE